MFCYISIGGENIVVIMVVYFLVFFVIEIMKVGDVFF